MPGKSKKGGGLESSPAYKKQKFGEAKSPFMMKGWSPFTKKTGQKTTQKRSKMGDVMADYEGGTKKVMEKNGKYYRLYKDGQVGEIPVETYNAIKNA